MKKPFAPPCGSGRTDDETAEAVVTRTLAEWGMTALRDDDCGYTWMVIGYDQSSQGFLETPAETYTEPYIVLHLSSDDAEITVSRAPASGDMWHVRTGDGTGDEHMLLTRPVDQLDECVEAIAEWITTPQM
ncbi:hypothetical protein ACFU7Y_08705 [Kitasatospora sp. NPDC057542]|uniref:hypothetical protein n=1 Tax=Kitasatospora sp. NPDC057542 TaxID=3346162 RepID=UPI00367E7EA6